MRKILYLHGFQSSGASGTVALLRRLFYTSTSTSTSVIAPDIPVDPAEALPFLKQLAAREQPDLVIGTSMGGAYAQLLRDIPRICVNPGFHLSKLYSHFHVGKYKWLAKRADGAREFHVYKETIEHLAEQEAHQFEGITEFDKLGCYGLFGTEDEFAGNNREEFERYYPGQSRIFEGGHRLNDDLAHNVLVPLINEIL